MIATHDVSSRGEKAAAAHSCELILYLDRSQQRPKLHCAGALDMGSLSRASHLTNSQITKLINEQSELVRAMSNSSLATVNGQEHEQPSVPVRMCPVEPVPCVHVPCRACALIEALLSVC